MTNRPLTQKEIDLAPEWATHYSVDEENDVCFESDNYYQWSNSGWHFDQLGGKSEKCSPIPRKPFDIESVEWSDVSNIKRIIVYADGDLRSELCNMNDDYYETKQDIINKFKALGLTPEDLK